MRITSRQIAYLAIGTIVVIGLVTIVVTRRNKKRLSLAKMRLDNANAEYENSIKEFKEDSEEVKNAKEKKILAEIEALNVAPKNESQDQKRKRINLIQEKYDELKFLIEIPGTPTAIAATISKEDSVKKGLVTRAKTSLKKALDKNDAAEIALATTKLTELGVNPDEVKAQLPQAS